MKPSPLRLFWLAIRPKTLPLAATPVLVGTLLAWGEGVTPHVLSAFVALAAALLIQIGTNLYNDAADYERGNDRADRLGPLRITAAGWAKPTTVKRGAYAAFALAFVLGVHLARIGGWPIVAIGLASLCAGWAYSAGPRPLSHTPFGEVAVWLFFGVLAVVGSHWLQAGVTSPFAWLSGAALGLPAAAVLLVNNLRDLVPDRAAGRRTLAAVLGEPASRRLYALLVLAPYASLPFLASAHVGVWIAFLSLPFALRLARRMRVAAADSQGAALNEVLTATARLQFLFGLSLAIGFCL